MVPPILPGQPPFSEDDAAALRAFLLTPSAQRFLRYLEYLRPAVTAKTHPERSVQSDERAGYELCFRNILECAEAKPLTAEDKNSQTLQ